MEPHHQAVFDQQSMALKPKFTHVVVAGGLPIQPEIKQLAIDAVGQLSNEEFAALVGVITTIIEYER